MLHSPSIPHLPAALRDSDLQHVILPVGYRLGWRDDDVVTGVDPHAQHVLHVADHHAVVVLVPHHFVLDLLPVADVLLNQDLVR